MVRIQGRASSVNVQKVMWCAGEVGADIERIDVGGKFGGNDTPEYLAKNPNGLIPTMEDGDVILWESNAIVRYLAETRGTVPFHPADAAGRGVAGQWMDWYLTAMHPHMTTLFWTLIRQKPEDRDQAVFDKATAQAGKLWTILDKHLNGRDFVAGGDLTVGDIPVGSSLNRYMKLDVERPSLPRLEAYYQRLSERPAYAEHVAAITLE